MYVADLPEKEMDEYKKVFNDIPSLTVVDDNVGKAELIARMKKAINENKPIPEDDPIYMEIRDDRIY